MIPVFFATDRARTTGGEVLDYQGERASSGALTYGRFDVSIPRDSRHQIGQIERPTIWTFWREDPDKHFIIVKRQPLEGEEFFDDVRGLIAHSTRREAFVFVHGFNVSFETAVYRTAQIAYDLGFDGAPILYSWPSEGSLLRYAVDQNNNDWTVPHLRAFLNDVASKSGAATVHLIAHSMGNRALINALYQMASDTGGAGPALFHTVILTAPDIDADTFAGLAERVRRTARVVTLYASSKDAALQLSKRYQGYRRAGDTDGGVTIVPGIDTIDVSAVDSGFVGHSYYGDNRSVLTDLFALIEQGLPPTRRFGLTSVGTPPNRYWQFRP